MRLLYIIPYYFPDQRYGGPIPAVHSLCKTLSAKGHPVRVFTADTGREARKGTGVRTAEIDGVSVSYFPMPFLRRIVYAPLMKKALRGILKDIDLVHLHTIYTWPQSMSAGILSRKGIPYIISPHGMLVREFINGKNKAVKKAWIALVERKTLNRAAAVHYASEAEREKAVELGINAPSRVIAHGIEPERFTKPDMGKIRPCIRDLRDKSFVLFLGRLCWTKQIDKLIEALVYAPQAQLIIAGENDEGLWQMLSGLASRLGVESRIQYVGPVEGCDKTALLHKAKILAIPSIFESFGMSALEALACGTPVLAGSGIGIASHILRYGAGSVVKPEPEQIGRELSRLLSSDLKGMEAACLKCVSENFLLDDRVSEMFEFYETVLRKGVI